jgi:hypothetical protein
VKLLVAFFGLWMALACGAARADVVYDFVRVACVPEAGMFDLEYRGVHDTVAGFIHGGDMQRANALRQHGFHLARGLDVRCQLGQVAYRVTAQQAEPGNQMCGASPEVYLTVTRNGAPVLRDVVFGPSCNSYPSVQRITFADGPAITRAPEAMICYLSSDFVVDRTFCDFFQKKNGDFDKKFPIDQSEVERRVERTTK